MSYRKYLTDEILDHYLHIQTDTEGGGIFNFFNPDSSLFKTDKDVWRQGGAMWVYAMAYRLVDQRQEYLDICEHIFEFIKRLPMAGGGLPYRVTRNADSIVNEQDIGLYSDCFCAMGCAQYYRVSEREDVKEMAERLFKNMYVRYFSVLEAPQTFKSSVPSKLFSLNVAMLAGAQFVRNAGICVEEANILARACVERMANAGHIDNEKRLVRELLPIYGYELSDRENYCCPGHVYEAAWLVLCESEYRCDEKMRELGKKLLDYAMPAGFEEKTALIPTYRSVENPDCVEDNTGSILSWPQQEAIVAYRLAHNIFNNERYLYLSQTIERSAYEYFADREQGRWYVSIKKGSLPVSMRNDREGHIEGPFHLERMLLALITIHEHGSIIEYIH